MLMLVFIIFLVCVGVFLWAIITHESSSKETETLIMYKDIDPTPKVVPTNDDPERITLTTATIKELSEKLPQPPEYFESILADAEFSRKIVVFEIYKDKNKVIITTYEKI